MKKLAYCLIFSIPFSAFASSRTYVDGTLILTQDVSDFERFHQFGFLDGDTWSNRNNNSPNNDCLVYGPYENMDFSGRVTARVNIKAQIKYGTYSLKTDHNYPWAFHFQNQEENKGLFTLDLVKTNSVNATVVPLIPPKVIRLGDIQKTVDEDLVALKGFEYNFDGWMDVGTVDNITLDPNEKLEVRVCQLGTYANVFVKNTELGIFYYRS